MKMLFLSNFLAKRDDLLKKKNKETTAKPVLFNSFKLIRCQNQLKWAISNGNGPVKIFPFEQKC